MFKFSQKCRYNNIKIIIVHPIVINYFCVRRQACRSLPGSPFSPHRVAVLNPISRRRSSQFSWRKPTSKGSIYSGGGGGSRYVGGRGCGTGGMQSMVLPCLDNIDLPYADDSAAVTPSSDELCNFSNTQHLISAHNKWVNEWGRSLNPIS